MIPCNSHWCLWAFILYFFPSLWISLDFLWISLDFLWISLDFHGFASNSKWIFYWFVATSYGFLWICIQFHRLSHWFVTTSFGFLWIFMDFYVPAISIEFLRISLDLVRRSAAEHARGVHNRASRKLHESVLLGCLSIAASMDFWRFCWISAWFHQIMYHSARFLWIFIDFY